MFIDFREGHEVLTPMSDLHDARSAAGQPLMDQVLLQIRDNLSGINRKQDKIGTDVQEMNARVIRLEEREERLERLEKLVERQEGKVDALMTDRAQREGASNVFVGIRGWLPVILAIAAALASVFSAVYLGGRATGVIGQPPTTHAQH